ncbi:LLM class flavin-dependent oxidoreductase [Candidatus Bathyarchaeota archaeon]|nr:LLM class flavin-dependent oxidoreductase [Candidatus Bathyarchaeota archaeon]
MRYGINIPNFGDYHDPSVLAMLAWEAEEADWDGFFIWDHIHGDMPFGDPTVALAAIATRTEGIRFGAMITPLARRRPWKVAREMVSLDQLSGGRLMMGVGLGNPPAEFEAFGEPASPRVRAEKLDEALEVITGLWAGEPFSYQGEHFDVEEVTFLPKPLQSPRIPIWVGGFWPNRAPMRRAARFDGVYPARDWPDTLSVEDLREIIGYIQGHRTGSGDFDVVAGGLTPGDPEKGAEIVEPWRAVGATWWSEDINGWRGSLDEMRERIRAGPPRA